MYTYDDFLFFEKNNTISFFFTIDVFQFQIFTLEPA